MADENTAKSGNGMGGNNNAGVNNAGMNNAGMNKAVSASAPDFGSDDLGRVQQILFGDHVRKTHERIDTLEQALLGAIADLRQQTTLQIQNVETRLTTETENRSSAVAKVSTRIDEESKNSADAAAELQNELHQTSGRLDAAIQRSSDHAQDAMAAMRADVTADLERAQRELRGNKVDRSALATMMSEVAAQLSGEAASDAPKIGDSRPG